MTLPADDMADAWQGDTADERTAVLTGITAGSIASVTLELLRFGTVASIAATAGSISGGEVTVTTTGFGEWLDTAPAAGRWQATWRLVDGTGDVIRYPGQDAGGQSGPLTFVVHTEPAAET